MKDKIIKSINRIEEGLLNGEDTIKLGILARKVFLNIGDKDLVEWMNKEIQGYGKKEDISKFGSHYRKLKNCDVGIYLQGQGGGWKHDGFRKYHVFEEWECFLPLSGICGSIKKINEVKKDILINQELKEVSDEDLVDLGLSNFVFYKGRPSWIVVYNLWHLESMEQGFREKLNTCIIEIQDKYRIENLPEFKQEETKMEINNIINNALGNEGNTLQSGKDVEAVNQGGAFNSLNSKSRVEQKPGLWSTFTTWIKGLFG